MEIGYLTALLGGTLALLSPCGALLLPAFFASTVGAGRRLLVHTGVFYLGLAVMLVPLGLGAALLGAALTQHRDLLVIVSGWLIVAFGLMQILGLGFDMRRALPGADRLAATQHTRRGLPRTFVLGTLSGVAGFCAGPILGAVLTLAAAQGSAPLGGAMLAVYAAGMVLPLLLIAWLWARTGGQVGRTWLRGRELRVGRLRLHTTSVITGVLLVVVGIVFLVTNGMLTAPELVPTAVQADLQDRVVAWGAAVPDVVVVAVLALAAVAVWWAVQRRRTTTDAAADDHAEAP